MSQAGASSGSEADAGARRPADHRLLYVITSLDYGGAEALVVELASRFREKGWKVGVVSMVRPNAYVAELENAGVEVFSLDMRRGMPDPRGAIGLAQIYRRFRPDVVHAHMVHANVLARVARLLSPLPVLICTAHNINEGGAVHMFGYRATDALSEFTTNVSQSAVDRYVEIKAVKGHKSGYIANGINLARFVRSEEARTRLREELGAGDQFVWLTVGRITEQKDFPNLFKALAVAPSSSAVWLVGDGELREMCEQMVREMNLSERVHFLGVRKDVGHLMSAADGFVLPSAWEGLPIVLLEAAASSLPAVATDVGGVSEIVRPGVGYLVPARDPRALHDAMVALENAPPERREQMGRAAREAALEAFDVSSAVAKWEALFEHGLSVAGGRRTVRAGQLDGAVLDGIMAAGGRT